MRENNSIVFPIHLGYANGLVQRKQRIIDMGERPALEWIEEGEGGVLLRLRVTPNGRRNEVQGVVDHLLKIRLNAPPVEGKANQALRKYLADLLDLSLSAVTLLRGDTSRTKTVHLRGRSADDIRKRLKLCP